MSHAELQKAYADAIAALHDIAYPAFGVTPYAVRAQVLMDKARAALAHAVDPGFASRDMRG